MKKLFFLMLMALPFASASSFAYDFEVDGIFYNVLSDSTVEVTGEWGIASSTESYTGAITIPSSITVDSKKYNVTAIGEWAFYKCSKLTSVVIPEEVVSIEKYAFYGCSSLTSVNIPKAITTIKEGTFYECSGLASITIPEGVTEIEASAFFDCYGLSSITIPDKVSTIGLAAFRGCNGLTTVTIPDSVASLGNYAFYGCLGLTTLNLGNGVKTIGDYAFMLCNRLTSINIPDSVTTIGNNAFENCTKATTLTIGNGVTTIGECAFRGCTALTSVKLGQGLTSIGNSAFSGCNGINSVTIPESVTSIGDYAFCFCYLKEISISNVESWMNIQMGDAPFDYNHDIMVDGQKLTELIIPQDITTINGYAFFDCKSLESITFHNNVSTIVQNAFNGCKNVKKITCQGDTPPVCGAYALENISRTECSLYVPESSIGTYKSTTPWSEFSNIAALEESGINEVKADGEVVISSNGNQITISGTVGGEAIEVYNVGGSRLRSVKASGCETTIGGLTSGNVYVVKIGGNSVKVAL